MAAFFSTTVCEHCLRCFVTLLFKVEKNYHDIISLSVEPVKITLKCSTVVQFDMHSTAVLVRQARGVFLSKHTRTTIPHTIQIPPIGLRLIGLKHDTIRKPNVWHTLCMFLSLSFYLPEESASLSFSSLPPECGWLCHNPNDRDENLMPSRVA